MPQPIQSAAGWASWNRRQFLIAAAGSAFAAAVDSDANAAAASSPGLIDVNVSISHWPTRRIYGDEVAELVDVLRSGGVERAWAGNLDALLHKNLAAANSRLAAVCAEHGKGLLLPFGAVNPSSPDWEEDLRRCVEEFRMPGVRLHPNYHGYALDDPRLEKLLHAAAERDLIVQLALVMEDERMMHPLMRVEPVNATSLAATVKAVPGLRLVLLNALRTLRADALKELMSLPDVYCELSMLEGVGGVAKLLEQIPVQKLLFGSHAPLFYFQAALLKLKESPLTAEQLTAIRVGNAQGLQKNRRQKR
jgi:predicted TIM-barrel fold metal-dependent hydrolase